MQLLLFLAIMLVIGSFGQQVLAWLKCQTDDRLTGFSLGTLVGLVLLAKLMLLLGAVGWLTTQIAWLLLAGLVCLGRSELAGNLAALGSLGRRTWQSKLSGLSVFGRLVGLLIGGFFLLVLLAALSPPVGWDALHYHLAVPKIYALQGKVVFTPTILHSHFPLLVHFVYLFFLLIRQDVFSQLLQVYLGALFAVDFYRTLRTRYTASVARGALILICTVPVLWFVMPEAHIEIAALLAGWWLFKLMFWPQKQAGGWLDWPLIMAGTFLASSKYSHLFFLLVILGFGLLRRPKMRRSILLSTLLIGLLALPWHLKSWLQTGNPIYPYSISGLSLQHVKHPAMELVEGQMSPRPRSVDSRWLRLALAPALMTFFPAEYGGDAPKLGSLLLSVLPLAIWAQIKQRRSKDKAAQQVGSELSELGWLCLITFGGWAVLLKLTRYFLPFLPVVIVYLAVGLEAFLQSWSNLARKQLQTVLQLLVLVALGYNLLVGLKLNYQKIPPALGLVSRDAYLSQATDPEHVSGKKVPEYAVSQYANQHLSSTDQILLVCEFRPYYLDIPYWWGRPDFQNQVPYRDLNNLEQWSDFFSGEGLSHLIINQDLPRFGHRNREGEDFHLAYEYAYDLLLEEFLPQKARLLYTADGYELWEVLRVR